MPDVKADTAQYSFKVGGQTFQVLTFNGHEEMSCLFRYTLNLWSEDPEVDITALIRQTATIKLSWGGKEKKYFGLVTSFSQTDAGKPGMGGVDKVWGEYTVEVSPTLWLLGQRRTCRIFQNLPADQIIRKVLDGGGMAGKYDARMKGCPVREYCVQYRETDLAFISRLMEEEGIFYYFTHQGKELMVIGDSAGHYGTCSPESAVEFKTGTGGLSTTAEYLAGIVYDANPYSGKVKYKDYDYRDPKKPLKVEKTAEKHDDLELYDYLNERYRDDGRGRDLAKTAVDAQALMRKNITCSGDWRSASAGCTFSLSKAYRGDLNGGWLVVSAEHSASQGAESGVQYWVSFLAIPSSEDFRPVHRTRRPTLDPQTATVVGPAGEKIYMDKLGRAKVQFHWDLEGKHDDNSSCWIRVATPYAGIDPTNQKKHGWQFHPLIGDEVIVDFLDGNPDNPVVVGSVYNADNSPIVKPDELVRDRILTPYQHQLLMDDKNANIRLNTGGGQHLLMQDLKKVPENVGKGKVTLATAKGEFMVMEDLSDNEGNMIRIETKDEHWIMLSEKTPRRGIGLGTNHGHILFLNDEQDIIQARTAKDHGLELNDPDKKVTLITTGKHVIELNDMVQKILVKSTAGGRLEINDQQMFIEMATPGGQSIKLDYSGTGIRVETGRGNIEILSPTGEIDIKGRKVVIQAETDVVIKGKNVKTEATSKVTTKAMSIKNEAQIDFTAEALKIKCKGTAQIKLEAIKIESSATVLNEVKGTIVKSSANGINMIRGLLVKIN